MSLNAAIVAATDMNPKKITLSQCQDFLIALSLVFFATKYIWFARINVRGKTLSAPVRDMKSPKNGRRAEIRVFNTKYPPLTEIRNDKLRMANALPLIPYLVSKYSYIGLANICKNIRVFWLVKRRREGVRRSVWNRLL